MIKINPNFNFNYSGARAANASGAGEEAIRRHGRWSGDRMTQCYLSPISLEPVRVLAGFPKERGSYFLKRNIDPPTELQQSIFPLADEWYDRIVNSRVDGSIAAIGFLRLIKYLRKVLLQDSLILREQFPESCIWKQAPFSCDAYQRYYDDAQRVIATSEVPEQIRLREAIPDIKHSLDSVNVSVQQMNRRITEFKQCLDDTIRVKHTETTEAIKTVEMQLARMIPSAATVEENLRAVRSSAVQFVDSVARMITPATDTQEARHSAPSSDSVPIYKMSVEITTVGQIWAEWAEGLNGGPAVSLLEQRHAAKWRSSPSARKLFSRRKIFIDFITKKAEDRGCEPSVIVQELDSLRARESLSLTSLRNRLKIL